MSGVLWDQPGADPLADIHRWMNALPHVEANTILYIGWRAWNVWAEMLGREPTVEDLPPGIPGHWTAIVKMEPVRIPPA